MPQMSCTRKEIEDLTRRLRQQAGVDSQHVHNMSDVTDRLKKIFKFRIRVRPKEIVGWVKAYYRRDVIFLREDIAAALIYGNVEARSIIAHELGHFFLKHTGRCCAREWGKPARVADQQEESEANWFAAFLLAPTHLAENIQSETELRSSFHLSSQLAKYRFWDLQQSRYENGWEEKYRSLGPQQFRYENGWEDII
jgi:Zn-dependent peptidase ImmA (M78 family)